MKQALTTPCNECPFLEKFKRGYTMQRLTQLALVPDFHCHKTGECDDDTGDFIPNEDSVLCAGAMIFLAKRKDQFVYEFDDTKLDMKAKVR